MTGIRMVSPAGVVMCSRRSRVSVPWVLPACTMEERAVSSTAQWMVAVTAGAPGAQGR